MNRIERYGRKAKWSAAFAVAAFVVAGCGGGGGDAAAPGPGPVVDAAGAVCAGADCVPLASAGNYTILTQDGATTKAATANAAGHFAFLQ